MDLGRVEGCFGVVNKFSDFAFCIFMYFFLNGKLGLVPAPFSSPTFPFQCTQLIGNVVVPGRCPVLKLSLADRIMLVRNGIKFVVQKSVHGLAWWNVGDFHYVCETADPANDLACESD